jgi:hypothetical protein
MLSIFSFYTSKRYDLKDISAPKFFPKPGCTDPLSGSRMLQIDPGRVQPNLQLTFLQEGGPGDVVNLTISIKGDELTLTSPNAKGFEIYRRER